jgi:hypothetical protein
MLKLSSPLRKRAPAIIIAALLTFTGTTQAVARSGEPTEVAATGRWKLTKAIDFGDITSLDEREARQLVGRVFTISKEHMRFGKRDCGAPELTAEIVDPTWFMREQMHASSAVLHLPSPVTVINLTCTFAFAKDPDHMIMHWKGWFFDAKRVR